jgi:CheY-like chemotaxis protein
VFTARIVQKFVSDVRIGQQVVDSLEKHHYSDDKRTRDAKIKRIKLPYARVLIVDDNPTNLDVARGLMKPYGMQVDCVISGQRAIDVIKDEKVHYNAIFMDHMMPGIDGIEATRIIREEVGTEYAKNIPIIALTANAIAGNESMFLSKGFQAFISKPVEIPRLDEVIRHWVRDKEQETIYAQHQTSGVVDKGVDAVQHTPGDTKQDTIVQKNVLKSANIYGLNISKGIKRFSGDEETYLDSLHSYAVNTGAIIDNFKAISKDDLDGYAIAVHGVKGSSYGVCADVAGDMAAELEVAAKNGDFSFVEKNNETFIDHVQKLIGDIKRLYDKIMPDKKKRKKKKPDTAVLKELYEACKRYDTELIDEQIAELTSYEYDSAGELVEELDKSAHQFKYKEIRDKLEVLFGKEGNENE